jgi:hypothetical protein
MGWLFAVALGLQERSRTAVLRALVPIAVGHEASLAVVVALVSGLQVVASESVLRIAGALVLIGFGLYKFLRPRSHPRWVGMRVNTWELGLWSFLMSSAHGAGLMLFPVLLGLPAGAAAAATAATAHAEVGGEPHLHLAGSGITGAMVVQDLAAVTIHTAAMLLVMAAVAAVVYEKVGLAVLRRAWVNFDVVWAAAIVGAGLFTLLT